MGRYLKERGVTDLECDVRFPEEVARSIHNHRPNLIIHCAGKSDVEWCEDFRNEGEAIRVNTRGTFNVVSEAEKAHCNVILISSAHVFSGKKWWGKYNEKDKPNPKNFYGNTKLAAETFTSLFENLKIVRTSYLFDLSRMLQELGTQKDFPTFIKRSFLHYVHFTDNLMMYAERFDEMPKILHLSGSDAISWYEFASRIHDNVLPRKKEIPSYVPRGHNLGLDIRLSAKLGFPQYSYQDGIKEMFNV